MSKSIEKNNTQTDLSELRDQPLIVCYGGGVDSTAMILKLMELDLKPDLITFANTGGEKPETYQYVKYFSEFLQSKGWPGVTTCKKNTLKSTKYNDLFGNCEDNETLPSLAFGMKSCSIKWKADPQDYTVTGCKSGPNQCDPHPVWIKSQEAGIKPIKLIGYDFSKADLKRSKKFNSIQCPNFRYSFPLQDLEMDRGECIKTIIEHGLEVPIKSACFFCPASQKWEILWLAGKHPELFMKALKMEHSAMLGKHSRWDKDECTYGQDWEQLCNEPGEKWPRTTSTVGLGRIFAWNHFARIEGIVTKDGQFIHGQSERLLAKAELMKKDGGNAKDKRTC